MPGFFSEERKKQGERPCWLAAQAVLPHLTLDPLPDGQWAVYVMHCENNSGRWVAQKLSASALLEFMESWRADPEAALQQWFGVIAPVDSLLRSSEAGPKIVGELSAEAAAALDF